jgi:hypothetical protein
VELVEDGGELATHRPPGGAFDRAVAFVDGVRRGEASLYVTDPGTGSLVRGVAGSHAAGAAVTRGDGFMEYAGIRVHRLLIWGSGFTAALPPAAGGWAWESRSIADPAPDAPLKELQLRMREEEGRLAEELCAGGYLVIVDGSLHFVRSRDLPVTGYIKTHHRALLPPEDHRRIPGLDAGERTSLFALGDDRYSCYLRLAATTELSGPWSGIVRIEIPQSAGLAIAVETADRVAAAVPRYAGVAHRDPRAPQNLQPVGALESRLRHLLGDPGLAFRAVREAVHELRETEVTR